MMLGWVGYKIYILLIHIGVSPPMSGTTQG
jgi:hypothetical protein